MSEPRKPVIDEIYDRKFPLVMLAGMALIAICGVIIACNWTALDRTGRLLGPIACILGGGGSLVLLIRFLISRVRIDENGADVDNPLNGNAMLRWEEIHTAAIVRFSHGGTRSAPLIVLATPGPETVLTVSALMNGKGLSRHEHVRIPFTAARCAAIEHYLGMKLPEYDL